MKRRFRAGNDATKGRRQKTLEPKDRNAPKATVRPKSSPTEEEVARLTRENAGLLTELRDCFHQRTATSEVLSIISRSTFDLAKVLNTVLELAAGLSKADKGVILRNAEGSSYYAAATYRQTSEFIESQKGILFEPGRSGVVGRVLLEGKSVQISDVFNDPEYAFLKFARRGGFRTIRAARREAWPKSSGSRRCRRGEYAVVRKPAAARLGLSRPTLMILVSNNNLNCLIVSGNAAIAAMDAFPRIVGPLRCMGGAPATQR